jgi:hypothetical protein
LIVENRKGKAFTPCGSELLFFAGAKKSNQKKAPFFAKGVSAERTSMCVRRTARIVRAFDVDEA